METPTIALNGKDVTSYLTKDPATGSYRGVGTRTGDRRQLFRAPADLVTTTTNDGTTVPYIGRVDNTVIWVAGTVAPIAASVDTMNEWLDRIVCRV